MTEGNSTGYRQPPEATRFKPGNSGNPRGRPKRTPNVTDDLAKLLTKQITVRENGRPRQISGMAAILQRLFIKAVNGDLKASAQIFNLLTKAGIRDTASPAPVTDEDRAIAEHFLHRNAQQFLQQQVLQQQAEFNEGGNSNDQH